MALAMTPTAASHGQFVRHGAFGHGEFFDILIWVCENTRIKS